LSASAGVLVYAFSMPSHEILHRVTGRRTLAARFLGCRLACVFCNARVPVRRKDIEIASNMYRRLPWSPCNGTRSLERQMQTTVYRDFETFESPQATRLVKIGSSAQFSASSACW
jgi:organic radical activating enzyme